MPFLAKRRRLRPAVVDHRRIFAGVRICRGPDRIVADHPDTDSIGGMAGWLKSRDKTNSSRWCLQPRERYDLLITNICWEIEKGWRKARCLKALS